MRRALAVAALAAAALSVPATAAPGPSGQCDGTVDVVCRLDRCTPDYPCTPTFCLVWIKNACAL